jgi:hypothetical protein
MIDRAKGSPTFADTREIKLKFTGDLAEHHFVGAAQLATSLDGLRRSVELTALEVLGIQTRTRERLPAELQRQYGLYVSAPTMGSLVINGRLGGPVEQIDAVENIGKIADCFQQGWQALCDGDWPRLQILFPDRVRLRRWVDTAERITTKSSGQGSIELSIGTVSLVLDNLQERATEFRQQRPPQSTISEISGYLAEIDFLSRSFKLRYPEGQRLIAGSYNEEAEDFLLANSRELIQVTGLVLHDTFGQPIRISDAIAFDTVDTTPIMMSSFPQANKTIKARQPFEIQLVLDESEQYLTASFEPLNMELTARTRQEIRQMIQEDLDVLWRKIALAEDATLTTGAKRIKAWLLEHFEEANDETR